MIRQLRVVLGPDQQGAYTSFLVWATVYGVLQGLSVSLLVPIATSLAAGDTAATWRWIAVLAAAALCCAVAHYVQAMKGFHVATTVLRSMHLTIGDHLVTLPVGWFAGKTGSVAQIAAKGTISAGGAAAHLMTPLVTGIAGPATVVVCMLALDWRLGLALVVAAPLIAGASRLAARLVARSEHATHDAAAESSERVIEYARCQGALRAFGRTGEAGYPPLTAAIAEQQRVVRRSMVESVLGIALNGIVVQLVFTVFVVLGAVLALGGSISGIELVALLGVASRFVQPLNEIGEFGGAVRQASGELRRIQEVMDAAPLPEPERPAAATTPGAIEFDRVGFGYDLGTPVLREVSFTAAPRTMTALVGPSGSGKTTIGRLLARFYDVDSGTVRVGGVDVRDRRTEDLMADLALVFQDVYLFDDTLRENVRLGNPAATDEQVEAAAALAGVTEIVDRLPGGWRTRVGEGGSALSGGERQRVSIARAILKDTPVVLLDEATAALDPENERYVQRSLDTLRERSTLVVIAHKLSTVVGADQILVLDDEGRIAERGTHPELLALGGRYAAFWHERTTAAGWRLTPTS
ncbi:MAG TPA: ABC transporter ATP-binding protein [Cellulomonas sp.]